MSKQKKFYSVGKNFKIHEDVKDGTNGQKDDSDAMIALAKYSSLGYYLVTPLLLGVFFGVLVDKALHIAPSGVICGVLLGTIATFYNLYRLTKET